MLKIWQSSWWIYTSSSLQQKLLLLELKCPSGAREVVKKDTRRAAKNQDDWDGTVLFPFWRWEMKAPSVPWTIQKHPPCMSLIARRSFWSKCALLKVEIEKERKAPSVPWGGGSPRSRPLTVLAKYTLVTNLPVTEDNLNVRIELQFHHNKGTREGLYFACKLCFLNMCTQANTKKYFVTLVAFICPQYVFSDVSSVARIWPLQLTKLKNLLPKKNVLMWCEWFSSNGR